MKELNVAELLEVLASTDEKKHEKELRRFMDSKSQAAELQRFLANVSSDASSYSLARTRTRFPIKILRRGEKIYAVKLPAYEVVEEYRRSDKYADAVMNDVKQAEARAEFLKEFGEAYY